MLIDAIRDGYFKPQKCLQQISNYVACMCYFCRRQIPAAVCTFENNQGKKIKYT